MEEFYNKKKQKVGWLKEGIYRKEVSENHLMKIYNGYGIDADIMSQIKDRCKEIRIKERETGTIYSTSYDNFMQNGVAGDHGDSMQYFLPLDLWTKNL